MGARGRFWWAAFAALFATGATWALTIPPSGGPDEQAHVLKAAGVSRGDLSTSVTWAESTLGSYPETRVKTVSGYSGGALYEQVSCWSGVLNQPSSCAPPLAEEMGREMTSATYVGAYQPAYYALVGLPTRVLPPSSGIFAARLVSVAINAALAASALVSARRLGRATLIGTVLAITPATTFLAATVNPQGTEILAAIATWATGLLLLRDPDAGRRVVARLAVAASVLAAVRPTGPVLAAMVLGALVVAAGRRGVVRRMWSRRSVRWAAAATGACWLASLAHVLATGALRAVIRTPPDPASPAAHVQAIRNTPAMLLDQVDLLSWHGSITLDLVTPLALAWGVAAVALVVVALGYGDLRSRLALVGLVAAWTAMPVVAAVAQPEVGWQGRYGLPIGVGITIFAGSTIDERATRAARFVPWSIVIAALSGLALLVANQQIMSRNLHGQPSPILSSRAADLWNGPFTPTILLVATVAATAAWALLLVVDSLRRGERDEALLSPAG